MPASNLKSLLNPEINYVWELAHHHKIPVNIVKHNTPTKTCYQKAELLGWEPQRVVKAIYAAVDEDICGFIFPELGQRLTEDDVKRHYQQIGANSEEFYLQVNNWYIPKSMEIGTCTPFVSESEMKLIDHIFIKDVPSLDQQIIDISVGGKGEQARKTSMHLPYSGIYEILKAKYDGKIHKVN